MSVCIKCGTDKPETDFYVRQSGKRRLECKKCNNAACRARYRLNPIKHREYHRDRTPEKITKDREASRLYNATHPDQRGRTAELRARGRLRQAIHRGTIVKPDKCECCGDGGPIHGHHDDYSKPFDVRWLCATCHGFTHRSNSDVVRKRSVNT
jgi:hypothetical protein